MSVKAVSSEDLVPLIAAEATTTTTTTTAAIKQQVQHTVQQSTNISKTATMKWQRRHCCKSFVFLGLAALVTLSLWLYIVRTAPEFNQYRLVRNYPTTKPRDVHTILLWNDFFGNARWYLPNDTLGPAYFRDELKCPEYRCELTNKRQFLPAVQLYDAIVFHAAQPFPVVNSIPAQRSAQQLYVFALMEPPGETKHVLSDETDFYNLSMTYRLDSDILWPYNYIVDATTGALVAPSQQLVWREPPTTWNDTDVWELWPQKIKMAAWFVSRCKTLSRREKLVAALQEYIAVDVYGKCGTLSCKRSSKKCDEMLDRRYLFYLAFENSLCTDYITEKLYNALQRQLIPVVFGGADYARFLPPQSYIDAQQFDSVEQLGTYLQYLSSHPEDYMLYFWWRRYYRVGYHSPFCDLCAKVTRDPYRQRSQTYHNIERWWLENSCYFEAKIKF